MMDLLSKTVTDDRFLWHRLALKPCLGWLSKAESDELLSQIEDIGLQDFFSFLRKNRLEQLWREYLASLDLQDLPEQFEPWLAMLREQALPMAAQQLKERKYLAVIHRLFEAQNIPYFIFKGANLRYTLYQNQTLRSSCDIDVFVPQTQKLQAAKSLVNEGFELLVKPENVSHEVSLTREGVGIDLHWYLLRPGRTRIDLGDFLFANREKFSDGFWGLNHKASLLVMLVHPAFAKHLASPDSMLIHMVDLHRLLNISTEDWRVVTEILKESGTRTAAWASMRVLFNYTDNDAGLELAKDMASSIEPGKLHRRYIDCWIKNDLIRRLWKHPLLIRAGFSLALQDNLKDVYRALRSLRQARSEEEGLLTEFEQAPE
jgi:hypothetical protein